MESSGIGDPILLTAAWTAGTLVLLAWRRLRTDLIALLSLAVGALAGLVPADGMGTGFTSTPALVIAATAITASALDRSGLLAWPARLGSRRAAPGAAALAGLGVMGAVGAALFGRAGARAALLPPVTGGPATGRLRAAVEMACVLGSCVTLVGSVPNLLASELRRRAIGQPFALLAFAPVGGAVCLAGIVLLAVTLGRAARAEGHPDAAADDDAADRAAAGRRYTSEVLAAHGTPVVGRSVAALEAAENGSVRIVGIIREEYRRFDARPDWTIEPGDVLVLDCEPALLQRWMEQYGVELVGGGRPAGGGSQMGVAEAVITPTSVLAGRTEDEARLGDRFGLHLLAIGRNGPGPAGRLRRTKLRAGDVVVLQGRLDPMDAALAALGCLKLAERQLRLGSSRRNALPLLATLVALGCVAAGVVPLWLAMLASLLFVSTLFLSSSDVYGAVPWSMIVRVGALLPLSGALADSGAANAAASLLAPAAAVAGLAGTVSVALLVSMLAASAVGAVAGVLVLVPVALALAALLPPFAGDALPLAVALGASVDVVFGRDRPVLAASAGDPGSTRWAGLLLSALVLVLGTVLIPLVWAGR